MRKKKPAVVGVTGGIGSGKTTILKAFEALGVPAYIADARAKALMKADEVLIQGITKSFGEKAYDNGELNAAYLAEIVFNDKEKLRQLNHLVHPAVRKDFKSWLSTQTSEFVVYESALIFEHGQEDNFDYIILVTAPVEQRLERVVKRNKSSKEEVMKRIKNQMPDEEKVKKAHFIIDNSNNKDYNKEVIAIYNKILNKK